MTNSELYTIFYWSLGVAVVVILLAAALLIAILLVARSILGHAGEALAAVEAIDADTRVIWALDDTNRIAGEILQSTERIEASGGAIVGVLHTPQATEQEASR